MLTQTGTTDIYGCPKTLHIDIDRKMHIKNGWVLVEDGKNLHISEKIGWVVVGPGKNLHILEEIGWVGVFIAITDFFIICSAMFFLTPPLAITCFLCTEKQNHLLPVLWILFISLAFLEGSNL